jgi:hypothetical protein
MSPTSYFLSNGKENVLDILSHFWWEWIPILGMEFLGRNTPSIIAGTQQ